MMIESDCNEISLVSFFSAIIHPPPTWTKMSGQDLEIITLKSDSTEYQKIEKEFLKSSKHQDVSPVQVIQVNAGRTGKEDLIDCIFD